MSVNRSPEGKKKLISYIAVLIGILSLFAFGIASNHLLPGNPAGKTQGALEWHWTERIEKVGGPAAYEELKASIKGLSLTSQHRQAHIFGAAAYHVLGLEVTTICDDSYFYGCFHEAIGQALSEHGLSVLSDIQDICAAKLPDPTRCWHSIGHGLVATLGYSPKDLESATPECRKLSERYADPRGDCIQGVFMEYNLRTLVDPELKNQRAATGDGITPDTMYEPCTSIALFTPTERAFCIFWLPTWWSGVLSREGKTQTQAYARMGEMCELLESRREVRACFEGLGKLTLFNSTLNATQTISLCNSASTKEENRLYCRSSAAYILSFLGGPSRYQDAISTCNGLVGEEKKFCVAHADLKIISPVLSE